MAKELTDFAEIYIAIHNDLRKNLNRPVIKKEQLFDEKDVQVVEIIEEENCFLQKNLSNSFFLFNTEKYIKKILDSFKTAVTIYDQYLLDFYRNNIYLNKKKLTDTKEIGNLKFLTRYTFAISNYRLNGLELIYAICNQSSFAFPYIICHKMFSNYSQNIMVSNLDSNRYTKIFYTDNSISFSLGLDLAVMDFSNSSLVKKLHIDLDIATSLLDEKIDNNLMTFSIIYFSFY